ncbi:MAG: TRAP transporter substrate-binding protein DctP [Proteobacteria bacterium]|nr:TRAP transporter substrate-binding protein DctP [Pseudomonadota bacterium]
MSDIWKIATAGRVVVGLLAVVMLAATLWAAPAQAEAKYKWKLTTFVPQNSGAYRDFVQVFIDYVEELTEGEVEIEGFGVGILANAFEGPKMVQQGVADIAYFYPAFLVNQNPANAFFTGMPGGLSAEANFHWLFQGGGEKLWIDFRREEMDLHPVIAGIGPTEIFLNSHKPVRTEADLKGLKQRTAGAWADILKGFGGSPTVLQVTEIFTSLERKLIDATEFATPSTNIKLGYHNVAKYIIIPGIHAPSFAYEALWRKDVWDGLSDDLKRKITLAGRLASLTGFLKTGMNDLDAMEELRAGKNEFITLSPEFVTKVRRVARAWAEDKAADQTKKGNPWMDRVMTSYYGFQDRWLEFSDYRLGDEKY